MERKLALVDSIQYALDGLNINAKVVRVSPYGFKVISDCAETVAELLNRQFCESVVAKVMSADLVMCAF